MRLLWLVIVVVSSLFDFVDGGVFGSWLCHWGSGVSEAKVLKFSMTRVLRVGSLGLCIVFRSSLCLCQFVAALFSGG